LWQAFPDFSNMQIIEAVKKSGSIYNTPDNRIGYGLPDFKKAFDDLTNQRVVKELSLGLQNNFIKIFPNPFKDNFIVAINPPLTSEATFSLYDAAGKLYFTKKIAVQSGVIQVIHFNQMQPLQNGLYILKFNDGKNKRSVKLMVQ